MDFQFRKTSSAPIRNYMRPTSCSDARKGKLPAAATSPVSPEKTKSLTSSKKSNSLKGSSGSFTVTCSPTAFKMLNRQSSLKPARSSMKKSSAAKKNTNRATCSSTLKNSKFPAALVLDHGATEAEGTSKMRVCPYTYCSLNGHLHETSPPLKSFVSARRKLLETQKNLKMVGLLEEIIVDNYNEISIQEDKDDDRDCVFDVVEDSNEVSDISLEYDYDTDQTSEFSQDEMDDFTMNFVEHVETDNEEKSQEEDEAEQCREMANSEVEPVGMVWEDDTIKSEVAEGDGIHHHESIRSSSDLNSQSDNGGTMEVDDGVLEAKTSPRTQNFDPLEDESNKLEKEMLESVDKTAGTLLNVSNLDFKETDSVQSSRWNISKKETIEDFEQEKEFNPRPPHLLPLEPDPDAEKVDLRHQMMDGRRNSEEWMVDYALQQAVTRLGGPARKRKVALLVEAFETVVPPDMFEKPLSHESSAFTHLSFIQACN